jgi:hypothetical protein|tara:strand:+ start:4079 stop:4921 length:843 start_codon:yes stop_codon:yes gene_type:complete
MEINKQFLEGDEYYSTESEKNTIVLHHTAGSHRPDWVISSWDRDRSKGGRPLRVATQFVIGGKSTRNGDTEWDGVIVQALPVEMWAHHIGTKNSNNVQLNKHSIGIEICNYGPLTKTKNGEYFTYVNSKVPEEDVINLGKNWRGYSYYQKYTEKQIESLKFLIEKYSVEYDIDIKKGMVELFSQKESISDMDILETQIFLNSKGYLGLNGDPLSEDGINGGNTKYSVRCYTDTKRGDWEAFEFNKLANDGGSGIWSHTNYRKDKFDVYPYPPLIEMLKSL